MTEPDPFDHFNRLADLIEVEREAEKEENKRELDRWPVEVRETLGKTVTRLSLERRDLGVGGLPLLVLSRPPAGESLSPFHAMDQGDLVRLTFGTGQAADGTLYEVDEYRVTVAVNAPLGFTPGGKCQIDLLGSDATYRRMRKALETACDAGGQLGRLRDVLLGFKPPRREDPPPLTFFDEGLNVYQKQAVAAALAAKEVALVHGPPGTGKTTVLVEIIRQAAAQGLRVLASAPSNVAVDNILEKLLFTDLKVVRMGHPARTLESLRHATLMAQVAEHQEQEAIRRLDRERERLMLERDRPAGRGPGPTAEEAQALKREIKALWKEARKMERSVERIILDRSQVVLATHGGLSRPLFSGGFDLAVLDEASQATEPLSWVPITQARKVVLAGDPLQLPPTIYSREAAQAGLSRTLMERLRESLPEEFKTLLRVQYRMHRTLMGFSSERFYEGKLEADDSVKEHVAAELPNVQKTDLTSGPLVYVDTAGTGFQEVWNELLDSRENEGEARLAVKVFETLVESGLGLDQVAVISPYGAQVRMLKGLLPKGVEVGTVDGFQGREKEVVVLSLVRSNETGEVGFLSDTRRMNVAMTRARRLLVVVGDSATLGRHPFYAAFLDYVDHHGDWQSAWDWK